jgi:hypothetical protein
MNKGEVNMHTTAKLLLASVFALAIAASAQAQSATGGDYYAPGPTTPIHATPDQLKQTKEGDYYVSDKTILNHHRKEALAKCTDGIKFDSDKYVACMSKQGESP